jgi:hypothetical protein
VDNEQKRLANALSSAGLSSSRVATELLYMLPRPFVLAYARLFDSALKEDTAHSVISPTSKGMGKASGKGGGSEGHFVVRDERAMSRKKRVDKSLRKLAREILAESKAKPHDEKCASCGRYLQDANWSYCPWCGKGVERLREEQLRKSR